MAPNTNVVNFGELNTEQRLALYEQRESEHERELRALREKLKKEEGKKWGAYLALGFVGLIGLMSALYRFQD